MNTKIYMAPMEGVTDSIYRNTYKKYYGGIDKYFTPFLTPNENFKFSTREWKEINPEENDVATTVPQLLTNKAELFLWACEEIAPLGFKEINFNLGCPSPTVVTKKKGSGFLYYPEELDRFFEEVFDGLNKRGLADLSISVKTRLGKADPEEFTDILRIYNRYPILELTIHPRITSDFYKAPVRMEYFDYAISQAKAPLVYNGEINSRADAYNILVKYPNINAVMIGRGLIRNPGLLQNDGDFDMETFKDFHDSLLSQYTGVLSGEVPVLHRMKEFWGYWQTNFIGFEKQIKKIKKSNHLSEYKAQVDCLLQM